MTNFKNNQTSDRVERKHLKAFPASVTDMVMSLVNECGVKCKLVDGGHLFLYPPDGKSRPFKIAASRPGPVQVKYLEKFALDYDIKPKEKPVSQQVKPKPEEPTRFQPVSRPTSPKVALPSTPEPVVQEAPAVAASEPLKGALFPCPHEGCTFVATSSNGIGGHAKVHVRQAQIEQARKGETVLRDAVSEAMQTLSLAAGIPLGASKEQEDEIAALKAEVQSLKREVGRVVMERDDALRKQDEAETRLALIKEAMGA